MRDLLLSLTLLASLFVAMGIGLGGCNTIEVSLDNGAQATITLEGEQTRGNNTITPATDVSVVPGG